jgi:hypothetical protein
LPNLPSEAKATLLEHKDRINEALDWIANFNGGKNPKLPSWARPYKDLFE